MPTGHRCAGIVAGTMLLTASVLPVAAQESRPAIGARVRVRISAPQREMLVGTVIAWENQSLLLSVADSDTLADTRRDIALEHLSRLEVSRGRTAKTGSRALIGAGVGLVLGAAFGAVVEADPAYEAPPLVATALCGGIGLGGGLVIGAFIGAITKGETWRKVPLDRLRVAVVPESRDRIGIRLSLGFKVPFSAAPPRPVRL